MNTLIGGVILFFSLVLMTLSLVDVGRAVDFGVVIAFMLLMVGLAIAGR